MSEQVETMFYTRTASWHGLGTRVEEAPGSKEALEAAGLNWQVIQKEICTQDGRRIWIRTRLSPKYIISGDEDHPISGIYELS